LSVLVTASPPLTRPQGPVSTAVALDEPRCHKITALIAEQLLCVRTRDRRDHSL
jgi:hypothetical protein